jgi:hypothetical protein
MLGKLDSLQSATSKGDLKASKKSFVELVDAVQVRRVGGGTHRVVCDNCCGSTYQLLGQSVLPHFAATEGL